eukprot:5155357-Pleurochrysis_carterae.AAC.2
MLLHSYAAVTMRVGTCMLARACCIARCATAFSHARARTEKGMGEGEGGKQERGEMKEDGKEEGEKEGEGDGQDKCTTESMSCRCCLNAKV